MVEEARRFGERPAETAVLLAWLLNEAAGILRGEVQPARIWLPPATVDVRAIRLRTGLSQAAFAQRYGFSPSAVRDWEQERRRPKQPARMLPLMIDKEPEVVERVLETARGNATLDRG